MEALLNSFIRTYVPIAVGQVVSWLALINIQLDDPSKLGLSAFLGGAISAAYYALVRLLEQKWPSIGILLGRAKSPDSYSKGKPITADGSAGGFPAPTTEPFSVTVTDETQNAVADI